MSRPPRTPNKEAGHSQLRTQAPSSASRVPVLTGKVQFTLIKLTRDILPHVSMVMVAWRMANHPSFPRTKDLHC